MTIGHRTTSLSNTDSNQSSRGMSWITSLVLGFFLWMNVSPAVAAITQEVKTQRSKSTAKVQSAPDLSAQLNDSLHSALQGLEDALKRPGATTVGALLSTLTKTKQGEIKALLEKIKVQDAETLDQFARDEAHFKAHKLAPVIFERHAAALTKFKRESQDVQARLKLISESLLPSQVLEQTQALLKKVEEWAPVRPKFDPNNLAFRTNDPKVRKPAETVEDLKKILQRPLLKSAKVAAAEALLPEQRKKAISDIELASILQAEHPYDMDRGSVQTAGLGAVMAIPPPGPEFLAPTEDVQITPEIQAKAAELHNNPVEIYNWVHNNVEWIPSYGSIQGSQMTLDKQQGNAFDTASLLIALLRASGIPARYVYGTVDIPVDKLQNWVGGTTNPDAAQNIMGQGGIPNVGLTKGGKTVAIRMEHVWVEAWVDFYPSRGAKNIQGDSWVPMDGSFKQYQYTEGLDLQQNVPFDSEALLSQARQGATVDEQSGYVQNLNQANIQAWLGQYHQRLQDHIKSQAPQATVAQVLGSKEIQAIQVPHLLSSTPYIVKIKADHYSTLPTALRHKFLYSLYLNSQQLALENPLLSFQRSTPSLASKRVTLGFLPATQQDKEALESYFPEPHADGSPIQPEEFPRSLPAYSIRIKVELRVEGHAVATSNDGYALGTELIGEGGFTNMNLQSYDLTQDSHIAGQAAAMGVSLQGISVAQINALKARLEQTKSKLEQGNIAGLTGEHLSGDLRGAIIQNYFASLESFGRIAHKQAQIDIPGLSFGFLHAQVIPRKSYGVPSAVRFLGVLMDVGHVRRIGFSKNNRILDWINYNKLRGQHSSAMEHTIPERFLDDPRDNKSLEGISAVKALAVAALQGQKIYSLTQENQSQLALINQSAGVIQNIRDALSQGKAVTVHQSPINHAGFYGAGYVISDELTGAAAYLIEGGADGGAVESDDAGDIIEGLLSFVSELGDKLNGVGRVISNRILGKILLIKDALDIFSNCSGYLLFAGALHYVWGACVVGVLGSAAGLVFSGIVATIIIAALSVLLAALITEMILDGCRRNG